MKKGEHTFNKRFAITLSITILVFCLIGYMGMISILKATNHYGNPYWESVSDQIDETKESSLDNLEKLSENDSNDSSGNIGEEKKTLIKIEDLNMYPIQGGSFSSRENANKFIEEVNEKKLAGAIYQVDSVYKVFLYISTDKEKVLLEAKDIKNEIEDAFVYPISIKYDVIEVLEENVDELQEFLEIYFEIMPLAYEKIDIDSYNKLLEIDEKIGNDVEIVNYISENITEIKTLQNSEESEEYEIMEKYMNLVINF